jgi:DNA sulfur modification protein DndC
MQVDIKEIISEIKDQYLNDMSNRPWIVAYSGGKDSSFLLQLVWKSVKELDPNQRKREIHVVCNNTLVENPRILAYVRKQLELIKSEADAQSMPVFVQHTIPVLNNTFWVNLIGRGYAAPNSKFRWCTERLKIKPTTKYVQEKISRYGEVIILLGNRRAESSTRAKSIKRYEIKDSRLNKHQLPGAYVYNPTKDVPTQQLWWYLAENESPWHSDNTELIHIYRNASDNNDCPLIMDLSTPACGGSRFGCWVCTVVKSDKSMQGLIESGEKWMRPLLELRNFLASTINRDDPNYNPELYRMPIRRNLEKGLGPYWPAVRKQILEMLLKVQAEIQNEKPDIQLITPQELISIQIIWQRDCIYEHDVANIYQEIYSGEKSLEGMLKPSVEELLLRDVSRRNKIDDKLLSNLLRAQRNRIILSNRRGLQTDLEKILEEYLYPKLTDVYRKNSY